MNNSKNFDKDLFNLEDFLEELLDKGYTFDELSDMFDLAIDELDEDGFYEDEDEY